MTTSPASMGGPLSEADRPPLPDEEIALMERLWAPHQTYVRDLLDEVYRLRAKAAKAWKEHTEFTDAIGYGNGRTEPSADLADLVEPILQAFSAASDHFECPVYCESCGYQVADKDCESCNGSGCGPRTAEGAYDECEHCAGASRIHEGCVGKTYAELAAENARLEGQLATARASLIATAVGSHEHWEFIRSMEGKKDHYTPEATAFAEGSEKGSLSILQAFLEATGEAHPDDETTAAEEVVEAALDGSGMPRPPAVEAQERSETPGTGSGRGTGVTGADGAQADLSLIPADLIKTNPGIRGGEPCITGTRIPASEVAGYLADGATWDEIREMLPSLPSLPVPSTEDSR